MAKKPRDGNDNVIQGKDLDDYIKAELQAMVREGLEKSPIQPATLHTRLKAKGIVNGRVSTLTPRKKIIDEYRLRQHNNHMDGKREMTPEELVMLAEGRTGAAYISKADRLDADLKDLQARYERNILVVADIIEYVDNATPMNVEDMLAEDLIRELAERKRNGK